MCAGRGSSNASAQLHAAKISKMKRMGQSAGMESSERTADPTVLQSTDLMSDKMLQGIYVEERSSSRTLRSSWRTSMVMWLGWALLTVEGVGLSVLVAFVAKSRLCYAPIVSMFSFCLLYAPNGPFSRLFASLAALEGQERASLRVC